MSTETQTVIPMISYEDGIAALEWLAKAFGFREVARICDPNGRLMHGELAVGDGLVMLASPTPVPRSSSTGPTSRIHKEDQ